MQQAIRISLRSALLQAGGTPPAGSILSFDKALLYKIAFQGFNILLLVGILAWVLYKPVKKYMTERTLRIKGQLATAQEDMESAHQLKEEYEHMIKNIEKEREEVLSLAQKKAMEKSDHIIAEARAEAEAVLHRGLAELELERDNMLDEIKKQMIEISVMMAGRFVEVSVSREDQDRYIEEAMENLEGGIWRD